VLELRRVSKEYPDPGGGAPQRVLDDVSLRVEAGATVAVVGPSGSGKSTLLNLMGALDRPTAGEVQLAGRDLGSLGDRELAAVRNSEIGFVFQLHHLLPQCTVLENILLPTVPRPSREGAEATRQRAVELLERVGLVAKVNHRPGQLSGGECQRVAVVRALINRPAVVLADEPTGSLDRASARGLGELLQAVNAEQGAALVVVTHSMELARRLDRVLVLSDGRLAAQPD
jgi:ABC-type lipoprotein export system ATPase subunit